MEKIIEHKAIVTLVEGDRIDVEMEVEDACAACRAKGACGMTGENREVSLLTATAGQYTVGEEVMVSIEQKMGIKAAVYAYMVPFFIILAVLLVMFRIGFSETVTGLSALGAMVVYYVVLGFFRHRIEKEIVFKIRKI